MTIGHGARRSRYEGSAASKSVGAGGPPLLTTYRGRMPAPKCPRCRAHLSSVETGGNSLWSCLECEGVWLPYESAEALGESTCVNLTRYKAPMEGSAPLSRLVCPTCSTATFVGLKAKGVELSSCHACRGLFMPKSALDLFARYRSVKSESPIDSGQPPLSKKEAAASAGVVLAVDLLDLFISIAAD